MLTVFQKYMQEFLQDIFYKIYFLKKILQRLKHRVYIKKKKDWAIAQSLSVVNAVPFYQ